MKEVMIILRPKMYFPTKDALDQAGFHSMTIREIIGRGKCPVHYDYDEGAPVKRPAHARGGRLPRRELVEQVGRRLADALAQAVRGGLEPPGFHL